MPHRKRHLGQQHIYFQYYCSSTACQTRFNPGKNKTILMLSCRYRCQINHKPTRACMCWEINGSIIKAYYTRVLETSHPSPRHGNLIPVTVMNVSRHTLVARTSRIHVWQLGVRHVIIVDPGRIPIHLLPEVSQSAKYSEPVLVWCWGDVRKQLNFLKPHYPFAR